MKNDLFPNASNDPASPKEPAPRSMLNGYPLPTRSYDSYGGTPTKKRKPSVTDSEPGKKPRLQ